MRVLHVLNHTRRLNGHVHAAVDLACAQVALGHVAIVASGGGDLDPLLEANGVLLAQIDHDRRALTLMRSLWALTRLVRAQRPDVVHAHMMTSAVLAWPVCLLARIPLITTVHNEFEKSAILMGLGRRVIAVSESVRVAMQRRGISAKRLRVVLNGTIGSVRSQRGSETMVLESPSILFVGGLHPRKGLPDLLNAFSLVHAKYASARLYVVGDGPSIDEYRAMAAGLACAGAITFEGPRDDAFAFMKAADILVLPSLSDPAPLTICEAREAGCAVIGTRTGGIPELLGQGEAGLLVPVQDPIALAAALTSLLDDPDELAKWRAKSQTKIEDLTINRVALQTIDVYQDAQRNHTEPRRATDLGLAR